MAVTTTHPNYDLWRYRWESCRDLIEGRHAIMRRAFDLAGRNTRIAGSLYSPAAGREEYIPRLSGQTDAEYRAYVGRASFYGATGRTVDALAGMVMSKPAQAFLPPPLDLYADDITLSAISLREFAQQIVTEEISITRVGVLVDYPADVPQGLSRGEAEQLNLRPFMRMYKGESILNWRTAYIQGRKVLVQVTLAEEVDALGDDEFTVTQECVYRVLDLAQGQYRVRVMNEKGETISESFPLMNGQPMNFIPFDIVGGFDVRKPLLMDLVDMNIAHLRNSADLEHGLHFTALPTPYVAGVQLEAGQSLNIGSATAWVFPDPSAKAEYLEFSGDGLQTIERALEKKVQMMAVLGSRMLTEEKRTAEATDTLAMRSAGERSLLAATANDVNDTLKRCLKWMAEWIGLDPDHVEYSLVLDFGAKRLDPQMIQALIGAYQGGVITFETLFFNFQRGEIIASDVEYEDYEAQITDAGPSIEAPSIEPESDNGGGMARLRGLLGL